MQCRTCHQMLTPAEVLKHEEEERKFEDFEHELAQCRPHTLEDVTIPDHAPRDVDRVTMQDDGTFVFPTSWSQPLCDRCWMLDCIENVFYGWCGESAYPLMLAYAHGTYGCPQSSVMAVSWARVVQRWYRHEQDHPEFLEATQLEETVRASLTGFEFLQAVMLEGEVYNIAREFGAFWCDDESLETIRAKLSSGPSQ